MDDEVAAAIAACMMCLASGAEEPDLEPDVDAWAMAGRLEAMGVAREQFPGSVTWSAR